VSTRSFIIAVLAIFLSAHRLPAPISEENPTPAPEKSAKPKPKRVSKPESESPSRTHSRAAAAPTAAPIQNKFDGTWTGTIPNLPFVGNVDYVLFVNGGGTAVTEKTANFGTYSWQATSDGYIMRWNANGTDFALTPNSDGQTALVTANNPGLFGVGAFSLSTVFRRTSTATVTQTTSAPVVTDTSVPAPVARAVPDRPGFVYNPFNPNSRILLDVRGKPSGTKLIEPKSGRLFIVP
jgi:hypothetical protein